MWFKEESTIVTEIKKVQKRWKGWLFCNLYFYERMNLVLFYKQKGRINCFYFNLFDEHILWILLDNSYVLIDPIQRWIGCWSWLTLFIKEVSYGLFRWTNIVLLKIQMIGYLKNDLVSHQTESHNKFKITVLFKCQNK